MEVAILVAFVILFFVAGFIINHAIETSAGRRHIEAIVTCQDHRNEGDRLIHEATRARNVRYSSYLRDAALAHYMRADMLENGPYKC